MCDVGWSDGEVSRLRHGRRHGETQAVPLSVLEGRQKLDPRGMGEMGTQSWNVEGALENDEEVSSRILLTEAVAGRATCESDGSRKSPGAGACQSKASGTMLLPTAPC